MSHKETDMNAVNMKLKPNVSTFLQVARPDTTSSCHSKPSSTTSHTFIENGALVESVLNKVNVVRQWSPKCGALTICGVRDIP
jgi:hypothetical protein